MSTTEQKMPSDAMPGKETMPLTEFLAQLYEQVSTRDDGLLGMDLTMLKPISEKLDGVQPGLYVMAAETNVGKTAYLASMFADLLDTNPDAVGVFFSFDDPKRVIVNRLIGIETQIPLNKLLRKLDGQGDQDARETAYGKYFNLANAGRFVLKDIGEVDTVDAMEKEIGEAVARGGKVFVMADGLHSLCADAGGGLREFHIGLANRIKAIVDKYGIPMFVTVETRKKERNESASKGMSLHDIMESGKYAYNASVVWILEQDNRETVRGGDASGALRLTFAKNKLSEFKGSLQLSFRRHCSLVEGIGAVAPETAPVQGWFNKN